MLEVARRADPDPTGWRDRVRDPKVFDAPLKLQTLADEATIAGQSVQLLGSLGALVMGGEAYVTYKQDLVDQSDSVIDAGTRKFLQSFVDQFAGLAARLAPHKLQATAA